MKKIIFFILLLLLIILFFLYKKNNVYEDVSLNNVVNHLNKSETIDGEKKQLPEEINIKKTMYMYLFMEGVPLGYYIIVSEPQELNALEDSIKIITIENKTIKIRGEHISYILTEERNDKIITSCLN